MALPRSCCMSGEKEASKTSRPLSDKSFISLSSLTNSREVLHRAASLRFVWCNVLTFFFSWLTCPSASLAFCRYQSLLGFWRCGGNAGKMLGTLPGRSLVVCPVLSKH
ncbi:hypothetical protein V5799_004949 [Amblyomma americanum]|uniref:Uncharacterized protein n=1 Tax=Amblyomma americanum TaxID=6943 RepID=A0AAQ4D4M9_AMBAM